MKYLNYIIVVFIIVGCEGRIVHVPDFEPIQSERKVLLEEMTGVSCPNCPKGTAEIESLMELYGDQLIPIGIHGFFLSWPTPESKYDFRNEFARELELNLAPGSSKPAALINRAIPEGRENKVIGSTDLWGKYIEEQLLIPPRINIELESEYDSGLRLLSLNIGVSANESIDQALKISVMILENNIIDAQEDLSEIIEEFHFNHVLRTMLTPYDGEDFAPGMSQSEIINTSYTFTLPQDEDLWVDENIEIVVFIHESEGNQEVLQADKINLF